MKYMLDVHKVLFPVPASVCEATTSCVETWHRNTKMEQLKKNTEGVLRAVLISSPRGVPVHRLDREYKAMIGNTVPFRQLGYQSLDAYLKSIPHVASFSSYNGETVIKGVATEAEQHVAKLVAGQKKPKLRKSAPARRPTSSGRIVGSKISHPVHSRLGPRFVPPRMQSKQSSIPARNDSSINKPHSSALSLLGLRTLVIQSAASGGGFASNFKKSTHPFTHSQPVHSPSNRKVELVHSAPLKSSTKKSADLTVNVSGYTRVVSSEDLSSKTKRKEAATSLLSGNAYWKFLMCME